MNNFSGIAIFLFIALFVGGVIFSTFNAPLTETQFIDYPQFKSVVFNDGRHYCEKMADVSLSENWEKRCLSSGFEKHCSLPEEAVKKLTLASQFFITDCLRANR